MSLWHCSAHGIQGPHEGNVCPECGQAMTWTTVAGQQDGAQLNTSPLCGAVNGNLVCDRERGHPSAHRGYLWQHDEVLFWRQK